MDKKYDKMFNDILVTWGIIWQLWILLPMLWKEGDLLECEMHNSPDTLQVLLAGFANGWE